MFGKKKRNAINDLCSDDSWVRTAALETIRAEGWLTDGSLKQAILDGIDLRGMNFAGAKMVNANFADSSLQNCDFSGADLSGAILIGADLSGARLVGTSLAGADCDEARFVGADLADARMDEAYLAEADLSKARVTEGQLARVETLFGATMADGKRYDGRYRLAGDLGKMSNEINVSYPDESYFGIESDVASRWYGVTVEEYERGQEWADQHLEKLTHVSSKKDAQIEAFLHDLRSASDAAQVADLVVMMRSKGWFNDGSLRRADFSGLLLAGADLRGSDLRGASFKGANLARAVLSDCDLREADFEGANLTGADLDGCLMTGINLSGHNLKALDLEWDDFDLSGAILRGVNLNGLDLTFADLREADLSGTDLTGALLNGILLSGATLTGCKVSERQLVQAGTLARATMPDGSRYDGRFDLEGDLDEAENNGIDPDIDEQMAHWYDIGIREYRRGLAWADEHLDDLRRE